MQEFVNCQSGKINIGASELTMRYYLLPYLEQFRQQFPNVNLQIHAFSTPASVSALNAGTIDFTVSITPIEGAEHFHGNKSIGFSGYCHCRKSVYIFTGTDTDFKRIEYLSARLYGKRHYHTKILGQYLQRSWYANFIRILR